MSFWLKRLFDMAAQPTPTGPILPRPIAEPDLSYNWRGGSGLFGSALTLGAIAANAIGATVTIPEDGFYIIDAVASASEIQNLSVGATSVHRAQLEILDDSSVIQWALQYGWVTLQATAVGFATVGPPGDTSIRVYLKKNWVVRWKCIDAAGTGSGVFMSSLALRQLYQD